MGNINGLEKYLGQFRNFKVCYIPNPGNAGDSLIASATFQLLKKYEIEYYLPNPKSFFLYRINAITPFSIQQFFTVFDIPPHICIQNSHFFMPKVWPTFTLYTVIDRFRNEINKVPFFCFFEQIVQCWVVCRNGWLCW